MNFIENVELALSGLLLNKMRSLLTMLGIIIGIGSVIAIFTIGNSFQGYMSSELQTMGANNITVSVRERSDETTSTDARNAFNVQSINGLSEKDKIQTTMIDDLKAEYGTSIYALSLSESVGSSTAQMGKNSANFNLIGINSDYILANDIAVNEGRLFTQEEIEQAKDLALVSDKFIENMGIVNPIGQTVDIVLNNRIKTITILGIYEYEESGFGSSTTSVDAVATNIYIPLTSAQRMTGSTSFQNFTIMSVSGVNSTAFATTVNTFMNNFYARNPNYEINASSLESLAESMSSLLSTLELAISAIAALALLVGGIGVMNIMLVSITERTREIGIRKALGATNLSIQMQFIIESAIITLMGGLLGIIFGVSLGYIGSIVLGYPGSANLWDILLAVGTSILIGVFFGYYPANKAAKLDPIEALRYE
jgi:putative ABC transport system permease protein